ncbi:MAG: MFS transporter, partial [Sphingomonadaceae bacterium]|nr:MFS transporter [Sphingomonadaceae bacterium]
MSQQERRALPGPLQDMRGVHFAILGLILLLYLVDGIDNQILAVTIAAMATDWQLPLPAFGTAMAAGHAGSAIGAILGGILADRFGRRPVILGGVLLFGGFTLMMLGADSPADLVWMRVLAGLGLGGCLPPGLALLAETMPPRMRGASVSLAILCVPLGIAIAGLMGSLLLGSGDWALLFIVAGAVTAAVLLLLVVFLPESPAFLAQFPEREASYIRLAGKLGLTVAPTRPERQDARFSDILLLLAGDQKRRSLTIALIFFFSYFCMTMVLNWLPALVMR